MHDNTAGPTVHTRHRHRGRQTRRVRKLANKVAEAHHLVALQGATVLISAHTPRVLRTIHRGAEAVKLVQLRKNPALAATHDSCHAILSKIAGRGRLTCSDVAPPAGLEPATLRLTAECSAN
jgi:hypothetical protein